MTPIEQMLSAVQWEAVPPREPDPEGLPYATHSGVLRILDKSLRCYRLSDGRAVFNADGVTALLGGAA